LKESFIMPESEMLLEQYKLYVEMADRLSARRAQTNKFYIALLTSLLLVLSAVSEKNLFLNYKIPVFFFLSLLGILLNYVWYINIKSYRQLNSGKFKIIQQMEESLPFQCYTDEWKLLGEGENSNKYLQFTAIEPNVPKILVIPYVLMMMYSLILFLL